MRGCACRGPHAGFVHIRCLVKYAEEKGEYDDDKAVYEEALMTCTQCRQDFRGPVSVALNRAAWLRYAGRAETDRRRQAALYNLGSALAEVKRDDEALVVKEEFVATMRRLYGPNHKRTILAEENVAVQLVWQGGVENGRLALTTLKRVHAWKGEHLGRDDPGTLESRGCLADCCDKVGKLDEAETLHRELWASYKRVLGDSHFMTLQQAQLYVQFLRKHRRNIEEARGIYAQVMPLITRVFGPDHKLARDLRNSAPVLFPLKA